MKPPAGTRWLMYHAIGSDVPDDGLGWYSISADVFEQQLQWLSTSYPTVPLTKGSLSDLDEIQIGITFDDGYKDNLSVAAPLLQKYKMPFSVFVIADAVRRKDPLFLSESDLRQLAADYDVVIGSHGLTHVPLSGCSDARLREELVSSKHYLEDVLGQEVRWISYPHGAVNKRVRDLAEEAGYRFGLTSFISPNDANTDPLLLSRVPVLRVDGMRILEQKMMGDWDWSIWKQSIVNVWRRDRSGVEHA